VGVITWRVGKEDHAAAGLCHGDLRVPSCGCQSPGLGRRQAERSAGLCAMLGEGGRGGLGKDRVKDGEGKQGRGWAWEGDSEGEGG